MNFVAGCNMPGYLPVGDPQTFDTLEDAISFVAEDMRRYADEMLEMGNNATAEELQDAANVVESQTQPFEIIAGEYAWWVAPADDCE